MPRGIRMHPFPAVALLPFVLVVLSFTAQAQMPRSSPPTAGSQHQGTMTVRQAREALVGSLQRMYRGGDQQGFTAQEPLQRIAVTSRGFEFLDEGMQYHPFSAATPYSINRSFSFSDMAEVSLSPHKYLRHYFQVDFKGKTRQGYINFIWEDQEDAESFVNAANRLITEASVGSQEFSLQAFEIFREKAMAWRALAVKPETPEEVRRQRLLAENAIREKDLNSAVDHYEIGLGIDPCWSQGHFNAALVSAELQDFSAAVWHMRCYLELVPDASDAQQAKDQLLIWQEKVAKQGTPYPNKEETKAMKNK